MAWELLTTKVRTLELSGKWLRNLTTKVWTQIMKVQTLDLSGKWLGNCSGNHSSNSDLESSKSWALWILASKALDTNVWTLLLKVWTLLFSGFWLGKIWPPMFDLFYWKFELCYSLDFWLWELFFRERSKYGRGRSNAHSVFKKSLVIWKIFTKRNCSPL